MSFPDQVPTTETTQVRPVSWVVLVLVLIVCLVWLTALSVHLRTVRRRLDATARTVRILEAARNAVTP
jgi:predicted Holliday junction resolvase-like endonuclease